MCCFDAWMGQRVKGKCRVQHKLARKKTLKVIQASPFITMDDLRLCYLITALFTFPSFVAHRQASFVPLANV